MNYFLLFVSVFTDTFKNIYYNHFSNGILKSNKDAMLFNAVCGIGSVLFFLCIGCQIKISLFSMSLAVIFAVITASAQYFSIMALATGSMSYSILFTYIGMIIPTIFGILRYHQPINAVQIAGFVLMIVTLYFGAGIKKNENINKKWFLYAMVSFVAWGLVGVVQQIHQNSEFAGEIKGFLLWTFVFLTIIFFGIYALMKKTDDDGYKIKSKTTFPILLSGIIIGAVNLINLDLSAKIPSIILFPILNGGVIVLSGLAALLIFKERLTKQQYLGIILGIISTCLLGM